MEYRIQFVDSNLQRVDWCKLDSSSGEVIESGSSDADKLSEICSGPTKTIVFLPQQNILLSTPLLPPKANKQQINSIAFTIEDYLAVDIDDCFFAVLKQQADHTVPVAVINVDIMDKLIELLTHHHITASLILPQIYLCPWSDDKTLLATICPVQDGFLIRTGQHEGIFCHQGILSQTVSILEKNKSASQSKLIIYSDNLPDDFDAGKVDVEQQAAIKLLAQSVDVQSCINLKQKNYETSHLWMEGFKKWQWPMAALVLLVTVFFAGNILNNFQKEKIYGGLIDQQKALLKQHLPNIVVNNDPKRQLIELLADNQSGGQVGFLDLLHEYSRLKKGYEAVSSEKIIYQQSSLVINLETSDLNSMESFRVRLESSNYSVDIENVNINPDKTTGRLVMRENK